MADVRLRPMSEDAYTAWRGQAVADFAQGRERSAGVTAVDAMADAQAEFDRLLPAGLDTPGTHLFTALDAWSGAPVGMVWLAERGDGASRQGFIYDILVSPQVRGQGYGRALLSAVEAEAARLGLPRIGLHVFGHNHVAIRLYETSGYVVTNLVMAKDLTPGAEDAAAKEG